MEAGERSTSLTWWRLRGLDLDLLSASMLDSAPASLRHLHRSQWHFFGICVMPQKNVSTLPRAYNFAGKLSLTCTLNRRRNKYYGWRRTTRTCYDCFLSAVSCTTQRRGGGAKPGERSHPPYPSVPPPSKLMFPPPPLRLICKKKAPAPACCHLYLATYAVD